MARKIKFPLEMKNGNMVRTLEELGEHFDLEKAIGYFLDGKLQIWMNDRGYNQEAESLNNLKRDDNFEENLCNILKVKYIKEEKIKLKDIERKADKIEKIKKYTDDERIISNVDKIAFNDKEFIELLNSNNSTIYLFGKKFVLPNNIQNKNIIAINDVILKIESDTLIDFAEKNVIFENIKFNEEYNKLVEEENKRLEEENLHKKKRHEYRTSSLTDFLLNNEERKTCEKYSNIIQDNLIDFEFDIDDGSRTLLKIIKDGDLSGKFDINSYGKSLKNIIENSDLNKAFLDYENRIS